MKFTDTIIKRELNQLKKEVTDHFWSTKSGKKLLKEELKKGEITKDKGQLIEIMNAEYWASDLGKENIKHLTKIVKGSLDNDLI